MDLSWEYKLNGDQRSNPVVYVKQVEEKYVSKLPFPNEQQMLKVFQVTKFKRHTSRLTTWGRELDGSNNPVLKDSPHWIAVRNGTPIHYDPRYPRYSHHLKVRCDEGVFVRGMNKVETELKRGTFYVLDAHSPHQILNKSFFDTWNVAVSIDSDRIYDYQEALDICVNYEGENTFI